MSKAIFLVWTKEKENGGLTAGGGVLAGIPMLVLSLAVGSRTAWIGAVLASFPFGNAGRGCKSVDPGSSAIVFTSVLSLVAPVAVATILHVPRATHFGGDLRHQQGGDKPEETQRKGKRRRRRKFLHDLLSKSFLLLMLMLSFL